MMRTSLKFQVIGFIVGTALALLAVVIFIMRPTVRHIQELRGSINATERILEEQYQKTKHQRRSMRELADLAGQARAMQAATVKPGTEISLITTLEELAANHHVKQRLDVAFTNVPATVEGGGRPGNRPLRLPYYTISVTVSGDFKSLVGYLKSLEDLPTYVIIDTLAWEKKQDANDQAPAITLRFSGRIYASAL